MNLPTSITEKYMRYKAPYTTTRFHEQMHALYGRSGLIEGGNIRPSSALYNQITVEPFVVMINGIMVRTTQEVTLDLPTTLTTPYALYCHTADEHEDTPVILDFIDSNNVKSEYAIIAERGVDGRWERRAPDGILGIAADLREGVAWQWVEQVPDYVPSQSVFTLRDGFLHTGLIYQAMFFRNGVLLDPQAEYLIADHKTLTLISAAASLDIIEGYINKQIAWQEMKVVLDDNLVITFASNHTYLLGRHDLWVFKDGVRQRPDIDYSETTSNSITLSASAKGSRLVIYNCPNTTFSETFVAVAGQTEFDLNHNTYRPNAHELFVFKNGRKLTRDYDYDEVSAQSILLYTDCDAGDIIEIVGLQAGYNDTSINSAMHRRLKLIEDALRADKVLWEKQIATAGQTTFDLLTIAYTPGKHDLFVFHNGKFLTVNIEVHPESTTGSTHAVNASRFIDPNAQFVTEGVLPGHKLRFDAGTPLAIQGGGSTRNANVVAVTSETELLISLDSGAPAAGQSGLTYRITTDDAYTEVDANTVEYTPASGQEAVAGDEFVFVCLPGGAGGIGVVIRDLGIDELFALVQANQTAISANASNISANAAAISTNAGDIQNLSVDIANVQANLTALETLMSDHRPFPDLIPEWYGAQVTDDGEESNKMDVGYPTSEYDEGEKTNAYLFKASDAAMQLGAIDWQGTIPRSFRSWEANAIQLRFATSSTSTGTNYVQLYIYKNGTILTTTPQYASSGTGQWETITISSGSIQALGNWSTWDRLRIKVKVGVRSGAVVKIGMLRINAK